MACDYIRYGIDREIRKKTISSLAGEIQKSKIEFDAIAFRGMSGAIVAPSVADALEKNIVLCRKDDNHHSDFKVEYAVDWFEKFIIVDDLISSGNTIITILQMIDVEWQRHMEKAGMEVARPKCVGIFLYNSYSLDPKGFKVKLHLDLNDAEEGEHAKSLISFYDSPIPQFSSPNERNSKK